MKTVLALFLCCAMALGQSTIGVGRGTGRMASSASALSIVASAKASGSSITSLTVTLSSTPAVGDLLVVFMGLGNTATTPTTPAGTWGHVGSAVSGHTRMDVWTHTVVSGDGTSYTFTSPISNDLISLVMYVVHGANVTTPVNRSSVVSVGTVSSVATPALTPTVVGTLPLAAFEANGNPAVSSVSTGWSVDQVAQPAYHGTVAASATALTTNTTTAISNTFTLGSAVEAVAATVLIGP